MTSAELLQKVFKSKARLEKVFQIGNTGGIFFFWMYKAKGTRADSGWILMEPHVDIIFSSVWNLQNIGFCWFYANKATVQDSEYCIWAVTLH